MLDLLFLLLAVGAVIVSGSFLQLSADEARREIRLAVPG
jgi:hypothetical protein